MPPGVHGRETGGGYSDRERHERRQNVGGPPGITTAPTHIPTVAPDIPDRDGGIPTRDRLPPLSLPPQLGGSSTAAQAKKFHLMQSMKGQPSMDASTGQWYDADGNPIDDPNINPDLAAMATQVGYIPKDLGVGFYGSDSIATGLHKKATTEGVGAKEFGKYIEGAELGSHTNYANKLLKELKLSDKVKSLGDDYVRGLDIKGLGDSYDDQRKAVGTLLKDLKTKKEALKRTDKSWMLDPFASKSSAVREFTSDYSKNKDRLNDLGITTEKEYENFINKAIGIAHGGRISKALGGRSRDI